MALELAEVAAGLPMAASFALAGGIASIREGRRRSALNEAMHELRRPLQALSLAVPVGSGAADSSLQLATAALERLEEEINGSPLQAKREAIAIHRLLHAAGERWEAQALLLGRALRLCEVDAELFVQGDPIGLSQALDNLINNALEHGGGEVTIEARQDHRWVCLSVLDAGNSAAVSRASRQRRRGEDRHRGHGLRVVERVARAHGGGFSFRPLRQGAEARLWVPLAGEESR